MMALRSCEWENCKNPAAQRAGDCLPCDRHLCRTHRQKPWHLCPTPEGDWEAYSARYQVMEAYHINELYRRIDPAKLCSRASSLRNGIPCNVELSPKSLSAMMGNQNCHAEITFQDNVKWIARFRIAKTSSPPQEVRDWILKSEAATMIFLQQNTRIAIPRVFDWACESDPENPIGSGYILMENLDGKPLDWYEATAAQKEKVMQQLVDVSLEIEKHDFAAMGSLSFSTDGHIDVQGLANQSVFRMGKGPLGPFSSSFEGSKALVDSYLTMIATGEIDARSPVDIYLAHRLRLDILSLLLNDGQSSNNFFIKHADDKGDHILVNDAYDIVGIIDWEWAQTVSKAEAFCSPCMMWPVGKFYSGSNELSVDELRFADIYKERGRQDLSDCVLQSRKTQRFFFALGVEDSFSDIETFTQLFAGLQDAFDSKDKVWEHWKVKALEMWKDDDMLQGLLKMENERASCVT